MAASTNANGKRPAEDSAQELVQAFGSDFKEVITVVIGHGNDKEKFLVHKDVICKRSTFFIAACSNDRWIEGQSKEVSLTSEHPWTFKIYLGLLYPSSKNLFEIWEQTSDSHLIPLECSGRVKRHLACLWLCGVWILADFLGDSACKKAVITNLIREHAAQKFRPFYMDGISLLVYGQTREGSGLRRWLVDSLVPGIQSKHLDEFLKGVAPDMLPDVIRTFVRMKEQDNYSIPTLSEAWKYLE